MLFNPDPNKQAIQMPFSHKRVDQNHPPLFFNNVPVGSVSLILGILSSVVGPTLTKYSLSLLEISLGLFINFPRTFSCEILCELGFRMFTISLIPDQIFFILF